MKLSALFSDGMVLQRGQVNLLWGYTKPKQPVTASIGEYSFSTNAGNDGYFEVDLPNLPAGGPYELRITADEIKTLKNIMIGDVFVLGGQSNMELPISRTLELYREEIEDTYEPDIRMFEVPKEYEFSGEREEIWRGHWLQAFDKDLLDFSAVGFFAAREIKALYGIPIGLIQTAVGGTPAKAWCSEDTIRRMGWYEAELDQCKMVGYPRQIEEMESQREQTWIANGREAFSGCGQKKGTIEIPGIWNKKELEGFHGAIRLTKEFYLTSEEVKEEIELVLGTMIDADTVYLNGCYVGETGYQYPPRFYPVPEGILQQGKNVIEIRLLVFRENGGFMPGKQYGLRVGKNHNLFLDLSGDWEYEIMRTLEVLPNTTFFTYKASALYNGMLAPVRKWNIRGCLFYQGESNTGHPEGYGEEMEALIHDWRTLWKQPKLPFLYVQLAGYSDGETQNQKRDWAELRMEQEKVLSVPGTAMVVAYDLGEYNDLHPLNKKTLGIRLALAARSLVYGESLIYTGPKAETIVVEEDGTVRVIFSSMGGGLSAGTMNKDNEIFEIELADQYGTYHMANAVVCQEEVVVSTPNINKPKGIRYAWSNCPIKANLYNIEGLPALPFRKEWS